MIVANYDMLGRIFTGPELQLLIEENSHDLFDWPLTCPICNRQLTYQSASLERPFTYFSHSDGSADCFETKSTSDEHRLAIEYTVKALYNRISEVTGEPVVIDVEKWIGTREKFVIADVRVTSPLNIAAEIFYKTERLALGRRLRTVFANDFKSYLVFHTNGKHNPNRIERYLQQVAPIRVGRFDANTREVTLGDLFSAEQVTLSRSDRDRLPNYIAR
ncbi:hypothetical protein SAMN04487967_0396 [Natronorubrum sediminis]|uniref:Competence protein CoiA-like family protein n=1 Tax=Natronorubrum sediminis TaxID=640943 RepID=A0A1H6FP50_9EURY|nr:hypothetical protein [Natronorubrum sediminis]SEH11535.1 hypothetical protein SAMN04487967_0396 [Natronorubrum sediminis]